jgi:hypothetical protein
MYVSRALASQVASHPSNGPLLYPAGRLTLGHKNRHERALNSVAISVFQLWSARQRKASRHLRQLAGRKRGSTRVETSLLCRLPHDSRGFPKGWGIGGLVHFERMQYVREGNLNGVQRDLLEHLSAEATRNGTCRSHVYFLRSLVTDCFIGPR